MSSRVAVVALAVTVLAGCPRPFDPGPRGLVTDPAVVLAALDLRNALVHAAQGDARANIDTPKGGGGLDLFVVAEEPARFRLEAISFFGQPLGVLATDGVRFGWHDLQSGAFVEGPATAENVSRLLPVVLPPAETTALLLGKVPVLVTDADRSSTLAIDHEARAYRLELRRWSTTQRIWFAPDSLRPMAMEVSDRLTSDAPPQRLPAYRAEFDDYGGDADRPQTIRLTTLDRAYRVQFKWRDRELDPEIDPALFTLERPAPPAP